MLNPARKIFLFLALSITASATTKNNLEQFETHHPIVGGVDRLCTVSNTVNGTCTISSQLIRLTFDFTYATNLSLIFDGSILRCRTVDFNPCNIWFKLGGTNTIVLKNGSQLMGKQVLIDGAQTSLILQDTSSISASGMSYNLNGTQGTLGKSYGGASFVGTGGSCPDTGKSTTYGNFNMLPKFTDLSAIGHQLGSIGNYGDAESAGGGRIVINVDSIFISAVGAAIQSNAMPFSNIDTIDYSLAGGSGGYIYINTLNLLYNNTINPNFTVEAQGGTGIGGQYGGSGGVIVFDGGFSVLESQVSTAGGSALNATNNTDGCGNGGAGTVWYRKLDRLYVDNEGKQTIKPTMLTPPNNQVSDGSAPQKIASSILIKGCANVQFKNVSSWLLIDEFVMSDNVTVGYHSPQTAMTLQIGNNTQVSHESLFDLSGIQKFSMNASENINVNIGNMKYGRIVKIFGGNLNVWGTVKLANLSNPDFIKDSYFIVNAKTININIGAQINAAHILMHADELVTLNSDANVVSYLKNSCNNEFLDSKDSTLFSCVPFKSLHETITVTTFLAEYNKRFGAKATVFENTLVNLLKNYTIYIVSFQKIEMHNSKIQGPRIGLCAPNITLWQSTLNTTAQGCLSSSGKGAGKASSKCAGAGGSHGGSGGYGLPYDHLNQTQCQKYAPKPYFYEQEARYEGSGGTSGIKDADLGGAGGGIIWIASTGTVKLYQSSLLAQGQDAQQSEVNATIGSGGGAGGSIQVITKNIAGDGLISLIGGAGSVGGGGGGAGGRLVTSFLQGFNASNSFEQSQRWVGTLALQGGPGGLITSQIKPTFDHVDHNQTMVVQIDGIKKNQVIQIDKNLQLSYKSLQQTITQRAGDGQSGTSLNTKCFAGFSGPFCKPCNIGTFKYNFGYGVCQPCNNKPTNSYYNSTAQYSNNCAYQCSEGLEDVSVNPECIDSLDLQIERAGGTLASLVIFFCFLGLSLCIWIMISQKSKCIRRSHINQYQSTFQGILTELGNESEENDSVIEKGSLHMRDTDLWAHTHRMYLIGENSISFPWYIPKDFPNAALNEINKDRFLYFIKKEQWTLDWTTVQKQLYYFFRTLLPYMSDFIHRAIRRKHFRNLQTQLHSTFDESHWEDRTGRSIRLTCDQKNTQLAYIDFIDYQKKKRDYVGPTLPMTLMLAGNGTLSTPYSVNFLEDCLAKSLVYLNKEQLTKKLPEFFENLNTLLDKLCFYKFNRQTMKDLADVIEWIDLGNRTLFNPIDTKMTLYLFENSYQEVVGGSFKQRRRSMPLESMTFDAFPQIFKSLIKFVQMKLLTKKSEIRFGLVIKSTNKEQTKRMNDRIRKLQQSQDSSGKVKNFNNHSISMLYNSDDEDEQNFHSNSIRTMSSGSLSDRDGPLKNVNRVNELSQGLLSESKMENSEIMIHGQTYESQIKIVDKSKRAFDISVESTRALELALQKDQKTCSNVLTRFKSVLYSIWLLLLKNNGKPPGADSLNTWFALYSLVFTLDFLLTVIMFVHICNPIQNIWTFGFPFIFILPGITIIAPLWGLLAIAFGSYTMMKSYANINSTMVAINYPLTIIAMLYMKGPAFYIFVICLLTLNKVLISLFGAKVRQHFANPGYSKNAKRMDEIMQNINSVTAHVFTGGQSAAERAAALVKSGRPDVSRSLIGNEFEEVEVVDSDEADDSFGIVSTKQLRNNPVTNPNSDDEDETRKGSQAFTRDTYTDQ